MYQRNNCFRGIEREIGRADLWTGWRGEVPYLPMGGLRTSEEVILGINPCPSSLVRLHKLQDNLLGYTSMV